MRGSVMTEADLVVTVGRRLDFQLAFGSPAVFGDAKFLRIADVLGELRDNRRGAAEVFATPSAALDAILAATEGRKGSADADWGRTRPHQAPRAREQAGGVAEDRACGQGRADASEPRRRGAARRAAG